MLPKLERVNMITPMLWNRPDLRARAALFGRYPSFCMAASTRVAGLGIDVAAAVRDARHRLARHARLPRDIRHGRSATAAGRGIRRGGDGHRCSFVMGPAHLHVHVNMLQCPHRMLT